MYRRDYSAGSLPDKKLPDNPHILFENWVNMAISKEVEEPLANLM